MPKILNQFIGTKREAKKCSFVDVLDFWMNSRFQGMEDISKLCKLKYHILLFKQIFIHHCSLPVKQSSTAFLTRLNIDVL